ncbi:TPA: TetR family transcriptional regulator [Clostridioides difficile]|uniref:TetR/AcrR family transcriptional regulator n=1 Tax=Romboutsia sp. TaxID=1965302 RepID=UPI001C2820A1|nr:TetR family transcriptional regulator [Clostridioides difficile]HBH3615633.1 TetR family transcriptional regulator [Clostridioides difficile]
MYENVSLTKKLIISKAIDILNEDGIDKLSMRVIASKLNVSATSIYWHFKNKDELLLYISEYICQQINCNATKEFCEELLIDLIVQYRLVLKSIRDSVKIMQITPPITPSRQEIIRTINKLIINLGVKEKDVFISSTLINNYVLSFVSDEKNFCFENVDESETLFRDLGIVNNDLDLEVEFMKGLKIILNGIKLSI